MDTKNGYVNYKSRKSWYQVIRPFDKMPPSRVSLPLTYPNTSSSKFKMRDSWPTPSGWIYRQGRLFTRRNQLEYEWYWSSYFIDDLFR